MDYEVILMFLSGLTPWVKYILISIGGLVIVAQGVVLITPSPLDNAFVDKILNIPVLGGLLKALGKMAPIKKK